MVIKIDNLKKFAAVARNICWIFLEFFTFSDVFLTIRSFKFYDFNAKYLLTII